MQSDGNCPTCGQPTPRLPKQLRRAAHERPPEGRYYMAWSNRVQSYRRVFLTDAEWQAYDEKGSID